MFWFPDEVIKSKDENSNAKWYDRQLFEGDIGYCDMLVKVKKLSDHPVRVGRYPENDRKVMAKFRNKMPCSDADDNGYDECWKDHGNA